MYLHDHGKSDYLEGPVSGPFPKTLISQSSTRIKATMGDDMDSEAIWDGLDNEKTWVPEFCAPRGSQLYPLEQKYFCMYLSRYGARGWQLSVTRSVFSDWLQ